MSSNNKRHFTPIDVAKKSQAPAKHIRHQDFYGYQKEEENNEEMNFNVLNNLSDDDDDVDQQCVNIKAGRNHQQNKVGVLIDLFEDRVNHHQDSTSVCPDSAASKKRKPQKMGTIKPGHINNHQHQKTESFLSDALKVTSPLLFKNGLNQGEEASNMDDFQKLRHQQHYPSNNGQKMEQMRSPGNLFQQDTNLKNTNTLPTPYYDDRVSPPLMLREKRDSVKQQQPETKDKLLSRNLSAHYSKNRTNTLSLNFENVNEQSEVSLPQNTQHFVQSKPLPKPATIFDESSKHYVQKHPKRDHSSGERVTAADSYYKINVQTMRQKQQQLQQNNPPSANKQQQSYIQTTQNLNISHDGPANCSANYSQIQPIVLLQKVQHTRKEDLDLNHQFTPLPYQSNGETTFTKAVQQHQKPRQTQQPPQMKVKVQNVNYLQQQLDNDMIRRQQHMVKPQVNFQSLENLKSPTFGHENYNTAKQNYIKEDSNQVRISGLPSHPRHTQTTSAKFNHHQDNFYPITRVETEEKDFTSIIKPPSQIIVGKTNDINNGDPLGFIDIKREDRENDQYRHNQRSDDDSNKGLIGRMFDATGEAFEKFGNFLRGESNEKRQLKSERSAGKKPPLHGNYIMNQKVQSFIEKTSSVAPTFQKSVISSSNKNSPPTISLQIQNKSPYEKDQNLIYHGYRQEMSATRSKNGSRASPIMPSSVSQMRHNLILPGGSSTTNNSASQNSRLKSNTVRNVDQPLISQKQQSQFSLMQEIFNANNTQKIKEHTKVVQSPPVEQRYAQETMPNLTEIDYQSKTGHKHEENLFNPQIMNRSPIYTSKKVSLNLDQASGNSSQASPYNNIIKSNRSNNLQVPLMETSFGKIQQSELLTLHSMAPQINHRDMSIDNRIKQKVLLQPPSINSYSNEKGKTNQQVNSSSGNSNATTAVPSPNPPMQMGLTPSEALYRYQDELTPFEKSELVQFDQIYAVGSYRRQTLQEVVDTEGYYRARIGEQIGYRYLVADIVDKGAFGQVVKCFDIKDGGKEVAVKISRNKKFDVDNASVEYKILCTIKQLDPTDSSGIVRVTDCFPFRKHMVLVFEFLGKNLYKHMRSQKMFKFTRFQLKSIAKQILNSLHFLKEVAGVIHCDLKPENILFTNEKADQIKVIDFGSSCFNFKTGFTYVQSRYYRAPEILLGLPYTQAVDMWSFGCIMAELLTGRPLFPALDENELLEFMIMIIGHPPAQMVDKAKKRNKFYTKDNQPIISTKSRLAKAKRQHLPLSEAIESEDWEFVDFLKQCLIIDPEERFTPDKALTHPWLQSMKHSGSYLSAPYSARGDYSSSVIATNNQTGENSQSGLDISSLASGFFNLFAKKQEDSEIQSHQNNKANFSSSSVLVQNQQSNPRKTHVPPPDNYSRPQIHNNHSIIQHFVHQPTSLQHILLGKKSHRDAKNSPQGRYTHQPLQQKNKGNPSGLLRQYLL